MVPRVPRVRVELRARAVAVAVWNQASERGAPSRTSRRWRGHGNKTTTRAKASRRGDRVVDRVDGEERVEAGSRAAERRESADAREERRFMERRLKTPATLVSQNEAIERGGRAACVSSVVRIESRMSGISDLTRVFRDRIGVYKFT